ncbi:MAG: peptide chain release factor N(5)-glutamine methyltransferase [Hylemonella sp.]
MEIRQALATACKTLGLQRLDAQLLLLHALGRPAHDRSWLLAHDRDILKPAQAEHFISLAQSRATGMPLAYLTGVREFYGLVLEIDARVLDPRADTETLVDWALELLPIDEPRRDRPPMEVIDLGTGSGAIALALKQQRGDLRVSALDASGDALTVAQANAHRLGLALDFHQGNWLDGVAQRYDLIVSNPPYIADDDPHLPDLRHEPTLALASGEDGLDAIRQIIHQSPSRLKPGGWLLLEHGWQQAAMVRDLLIRAGFCAAQSRRDLAGIERCSGGQWPG